MFDISWSEILVIAVLAIIVIGPKDLPKVMRVAGRMVRKARLMAAEFRDGIEKMAEDAELEEVKKSIHHVSNFDPKRALQNTIDPTGGSVPQPVLKEDVALKAKPIGARKPKAKAPAAKAPVVRSPAVKSPAPELKALKAPPVKPSARPAEVKKAPARKASGKAAVDKSGAKR